MELRIAVDIDSGTTSNKVENSVPLVYFDNHTGGLIVQQGNRRHLVGRLLRPECVNIGTELEGLPYKFDLGTVWDIPE